ncbi:MAG: beta-ketoacyl-ACP synthase III [Phycisphaerae bacterium]
MPDSPRAAITGLGVAVPQRAVTNEDLETFVDTTDEWITQRTGIKTRRVVSEGQSTASLAIDAARASLDDAGIKPEDLDLIICATVCPEMTLPATACFVQNELGARDVPAFDLGAACSGWLYGLTVGEQFITTGKYRRVLVIGAEALTRFTDWTDRTTCVLFGDGAGAAVLEPSDDDEKGILYSVMHADGTGWDYIHVPAGGAREVATHQTVADRRHFIKMRGRDVYKFAVEKMQWLLAVCTSACGLTPDDVDLVVPHQVNVRIIKSATDKLGFPLEKVYMNIDRYGNTSAASIPLAMGDARGEGLIGPGSLVLLVAFGAGLTWAGTVVRL